MWLSIPPAPLGVFFFFKETSSHYIYWWFLYIFLHIFMCMSVLSACISAYHVHSSAYGGEKQALDPLELELWVLWSTMWAPETKHGFYSFGRLGLCRPGSCFIDQAAFKLVVIFLPLPLECWDYRQVLHLATVKICKILNISFQIITSLLPPWRSPWMPFGRSFSLSFPVGTPLDSDL